MRHAANIVQPEFVFAEGSPHVAAARACLPNAQIVTCDPAAIEDGAVDFAELCAGQSTHAVDEAIEKITPETHAAYMNRQKTTNKDAEHNNNKTT